MIGHGCVVIKYVSDGVVLYETFNYTGADQTWTVPSGVTSAVFFLLGAGGGGSTYATFGDGGGGGVCPFYHGVSRVSDGSMLVIGENFMPGVMNGLAVWDTKNRLGNHVNMESLDSKLLHFLHYLFFPMFWCFRI